ncbi:MAG: class I SAM-dependent methyltransferase [Cyanobacteria bacterium REEB67]|nr:class I SAM-dependent methyltransferase [Cyanobacteria bacterium REEB67]
MSDGQDMSNLYDWESSYRAGTDLPWDCGKPADELVEYFQGLGEAKPRSVLEIGCGTGTNAVWMAGQGCCVTATEIAPTALKMAAERAERAGVRVDLRQSYVGEALPVDAGSHDFAFDRGVYHVIPAAQRAFFVANLAAALETGAYWLSLAGCKDEHRDDPQVGPPQLSAVELLQHIEPLFEVIKLERSKFIIETGRTYLAWKALYRKR